MGHAIATRPSGHRKPQQLLTFVAKNKKCKELLKRNRRNHEQINGFTKMAEEHEQIARTIERQRREQQHTK